MTKDGAPTAGATVQTTIWPSEEYLATLKKGDEVPMLTLPASATAADGSFHVQVPWASVPAKFRDAAGSVDLQVSADDGSGRLLWEVPAVAGASSSTIAKASVKKLASSPTVAVAGTSPVQLNFELGQKPAVLDVKAAKQQVIGKIAGMSANGFSAQAKLPSARRFTTAGRLTKAAPGPCTTSTGSTYNNRLERWGYIYAWSGTSTTVENDDGNVHTLGVGYKASGGNWSQNGTSSLSESSSSGGSISNVKDSSLGNRVNVRDYVTVCQGVGYTTRKAIGTYAQLTDFSYSTHPNWGNCVTYSSGTFYKSSGKNVTVGGGLDIGPISVTAQAGWNSATKLTWKVNSKSKYCGSTSAGPASAPQASMSKA